MAHDMIGSMMAEGKKASKFSEMDEMEGEYKEAGKIKEMHIKVMGDDKFEYKVMTEKGKMMSYMMDSMDEVMSAMHDDMESPHIRKSHKGLSSMKARKILSDKEVRGNPLTRKQRGYFGAVASK